jgi:tagatose-1,6-bisphosphate aldolase
MEPPILTTFGKYRHLSRSSTPQGHFLILAIDHRVNLLNDLNKYAPHPLTDEDFVDFKQQVIRALVAYTSGVLVDPVYGIGHAIVDGTIRVGLLAPLEVTDYDLHPSQRTIRFIPDWSVEKIKRVGGDGVKLLLPFHPDAANTPEKLAVVQQIVDDCCQFDIPFFLEPVPYSLNPDVPLSNVELRQVSVHMAELFSSMGVDVLKMQFPVDAKQSTDLDEWRAACADLNAACSVPWALLSGGVDYATFEQQARIACLAGASGVIAGRAIWAEAIRLQGDERAIFLVETALQRLVALGQIVSQSGIPWTKKVVVPAVSLTWYVGDVIGNAGPDSDPT